MWIVPAAQTTAQEGGNNKKDNKRYGVTHNQVWRLIFTGKCISTAFQGVASAFASTVAMAGAAVAVTLFEASASRCFRAVTA